MYIISMVTIDKRIQFVHAICAHDWVHTICVRNLCAQFVHAIVCTQLGAHIIDYDFPFSRTRFLFPGRPFFPVSHY